MSYQKLTVSMPLIFPVKCQCSACNAINDCRVSFTVTGEAAINVGSPFGRKERAKLNANIALRNNMKYHILKLYEECGTAPDKFIRYMKEQSCSSCGKPYPWTEIDGATREDSGKTMGVGLIPALFSLSSKKFRGTSKDVKAAINSIPRVYLPYPALDQNDMIAQYGLSDANEHNADLTAEFMHS